MEYSAVLSNSVEILPHREFVTCCLRTRTLFVNIGVISCEIINILQRFQRQSNTHTHIYVHYNREVYFI